MHERYYQGLASPRLAVCNYSRSCDFMLHPDPESMDEGTLLRQSNFKREVRNLFILQIGPIDTVQMASISYKI